MLTKQADIAALIGSRICHDLINPIGAISNGLELLELSGASQSPELALIADSVRAANAKIRFLRIAFGDPGKNAAISHAETADILGGYYNDPRTKLLWNIKTPLERRDLRLLFLLLLCMEKLAPFGGHITVDTCCDGFKMAVITQDPKADGLVDFKNHRFCPQGSPPLIQFNLAQLDIDRVGYRMECARLPDGLNFTIKA